MVLPGQSRNAASWQVEEPRRRGSGTRTPCLSIERRQRMPNVPGDFTLAKRCFSEAKARHHFRCFGFCPRGFMLRTLGPSSCSTRLWVMRKGFYPRASWQRIPVAKIGRSRLPLSLQTSSARRRAILAIFRCCATCCWETPSGRWRRECDFMLRNTPLLRSSAQVLISANRLPEASHCLKAFGALDEADTCFSSGSVFRPDVLSKRTVESCLGLSLCSRAP